MRDDTDREKIDTESDGLAYVTIERKRREKRKGKENDIMRIRDRLIDRQVALHHIVFRQAI